MVGEGSPTRHSDTRHYQLGGTVGTRTGSGRRARVIILLPGSHRLTTEVIGDGNIVQMSHRLIGNGLGAAGKRGGVIREIEVQRR